MELVNIAKDPFNWRLAVKVNDYFSRQCVLKK